MLSRYYWRHFAGTMTLALLLLRSAHADAPRAIPFQARLTTVTGQPVDNSTQAITITLYDAATGGSVLYTEVQTVPVSKGLLATTIGSVDPVTFNALPFNAPYWIGVTVGSDAEMTPRVPLSAVPYANFAQGVPYAGITGAPTSLPPGGAAGGDLAGSYPNPALATLASSLAKVSGGAMSTDGTNLFLSPSAGISFADNGQIRSQDDNHRLLFRRADNILELREYGDIILSSGASSGQETDALVVKGNGNVGIGAGTNPAAKLDVNGGARIEGNNTLEFGGGVSGKESNAGKIGYQTFSADSLDIIGAGTTGGNRKVKIYAEGGTTYTGGVTVPALNLASGAGSGKVLTSDASGNATWQGIPAQTASGAAGGDLSGSYPNPSIASGAVTFDKLAPTVLSTLSPVLAQFVVSLDLSQVGSLAIGDSNPSYIAFKGNYVFVEGNVNSSSGKLYTIDVTNPLSPVLKTTTATATPRDLALTGNYVFVSVNSGGVQPVDITNPLAPVVKSIVASNAGAIAASGNTLVVAAGNSNHTLQTFDISAPAAPVLKGSAFLDTGGISHKVTLAGSYAYVAAENSTKLLQVFNVSNLTSPTLAGSVGTGGYGQAIAVQGNYAYVLEYSPNKLDIIDVGVPTAPVIKSSLVLTGTTGNSTITLAGNTAYVVSHGSGLDGSGSTIQAISIVSPTAPSILKTQSVSNGTDVAVTSGDYAFVTGTNIFALKSYHLYNSVLSSDLSINGKITFADGTSLSTATAGGDLTGTFPNPTIAALAVSTGKIADGAVGNVKLASDAGSLNKVSGGAMAVGVANRVGIGTTTPVATLDVKGTLNVNIPGNPNGPFFDLNIGDENTGWDWQSANRSVLYQGFRPGVTLYNPVAGNPTYVGIGSDSTPAYALELPNVASTDGRGRANSWVTYSSGRWKHNITPIEDPLGKVLALNGVMFDWNKENGGSHDIGFVAEDVGRVVPELVAWEPDGSGYAQGMKYDRVTALTVEAIKAQQKEIADLKTRNAALASEAASQKRRNDALEERVKRLESLIGTRVSWQR